MSLLLAKPFTHAYLDEYPYAQYKPFRARALTSKCASYGVNPIGDKHVFARNELIRPQYFSTLPAAGAERGWLTCCRVFLD